MGRPTGKAVLDDPEKQGKVIAMIANWVSRKDAAIYVGLSERAFHYYCKSHPDFASAIKEAESERKEIALGCILKAAKKGQWTAAAWLLERCFPNQFGRTNRDELVQAKKLMKREAEIMVKKFFEAVYSVAPPELAAKIAAKFEGIEPSVEQTPSDKVSR